MSRYDELNKLQALKDSGALTEEEFEREKQRILNTPEPQPYQAGPVVDNSTRPWGMDLKVFCMLMHLSQLAGFAIPFAGFVLPVVMWAMFKDQFPEVNTHGRVIFNWMVSAFIYAAVSFVLMLIFVGFLTMIAVGLLGIIFPIIGALKANEGVVWRYPLSIRFFD